MKGGKWAQPQPQSPPGWGDCRKQERGLHGCPELWEQGEQGNGETRKGPERVMR